jgi:hypothetical protein
VVRVHAAPVQPARADVAESGRDHPAGPLVRFDEGELPGSGGDPQDPDRQGFLDGVPPGLPPGPGGHVLHHQHAAGCEHRGTRLQQRPLARLVEEVQHVHEDDGVPWTLGNGARVGDREVQPATVGRRGRRRHDDLVRVDVHAQHPQFG